MRKLSLIGTLASEINSKLCSVWDINNHFWYPLYDCVRDDLISFDKDCIFNDEKLIFIKNVLICHGVSKLYEVREFDYSYEIDSIANYDFWNSEPHMREIYWFDDNMDWIIYLSHDGTITFGGQWFIDKLKDEWSDWKGYLLYDTKN